MSDYMDAMDVYRQRRYERTHCDMPQSSPCHAKAGYMAMRLNQGASMKEVAKEFYPKSNYENASVNIYGMLRKHGYVVDSRQVFTVRHEHDS